MSAVEKGYMKKVFFIIMSYSKGGGAEALLTKIVNNLNPDKYEIGIMEIVHDTIKRESVNENIKIYPYYVEANDPERKRKMHAIYHEWDKVIEQYIPQDYDLYVSFNYQRPTFLLPSGKKTIAWIHGDVYNLLEENMQEERALQDRAFCKTKHIVSISDITTQSLIDVFPEHKEKLHIIYNGIDVNGIREKAKEYTQIKLQHPAILSVGRLDANKNPIRLLNIFEKVRRKNRQIHLYYLGYGTMAEIIKEKAKEKEISDYVHLLGYRENPFPIIAQCDISCMFSLSEGFPMALLESVALDKPFVSSIVGGAKILANEQRCGKVVETDEEAVDAILDLLQTEKEYLIRECRESIKRFDLKLYIRQIEALFDEVLSEG